MEQYVKDFQGFTPVKMCGVSPLASFYFIIIIIIIIIIVVVVVVDDDTDYWVCLSSDHLFQVYYKVRQVLLQSATGITKCDNFITKCDRYYKVWQYRPSFPGRWELLWMHLPVSKVMNSPSNAISIKRFFPEHNLTCGWFPQQFKGL